jgi:hypothetical protein
MGPQRQRLVVARPGRAADLGISLISLSGEGWEQLQVRGRLHGALTHALPRAFDLLHANFAGGVGAPNEPRSG